MGAGVDESFLARPSRRRFFVDLACATSALVLGQIPLAGQGASGVHFSVAEFDRLRTLGIAKDALTRGPVVLVDIPTPDGVRSQTFYSEQTNTMPSVGGQLAGSPFTAHVNALVQMDRALSGLVAAWRLTGDAAYFDAAYRQARAWFIDDKTRMLPTLELAGVVLGVADARNNGVTQTVALADSARALAFLCASSSMPEVDSTKIRAWFTELLAWFTDSKKGSIARQAKTLDSVCWTMQASEFARFTRNDIVLKECNHLFRDGLLRQMNFDGYFPLALRHENPYATSMFTLECMASACESLSTPYESVWKYALPDGRGMHSAVAWAAPYLRDRGKWPYVADRQHFSAEPMRQNSLLFAGRAFDLIEYTDLWKSLRADSSVLLDEHPISEPALWATRPPA